MPSAFLNSATKSPMILVKVIAAQQIITVSGFYFKDAVPQFKDGNVEGTAAQVKNENRMVVAFIEAVGQSRRRGLVDNTKHLQTGNGAGIFGRLALAIGKYAGTVMTALSTGGSPDTRFGISFQFLQNHCGNFLRGVGFIINMYFIILAHMTFNRHYGFIRIGMALRCGHRPDKMSRNLKGSNRRGGSTSFSVGNNDCLPPSPSRQRRNLWYPSQYSMISTLYKLPPVSNYVKPLLSNNNDTGFYPILY